MSVGHHKKRRVRGGTSPPKEAMSFPREGSPEAPNLGTRMATLSYQVFLDSLRTPRALGTVSMSSLKKTDCLITLILEPRECKDV